MLWRFDQNEAYWSYEKVVQENRNWNFRQVTHFPWSCHIMSSFLPFLECYYTSTYLFTIIFLLFVQDERIQWYECEFAGVDNDGKLEFIDLQDNFYVPVSIIKCYWIYYTCVRWVLQFMNKPIRKIVFALYVKQCCDDNSTPNPQDIYLE